MVSTNYSTRKKEQTSRMDNADAMTLSNNVNGGGNEVIVDIAKMLQELEPPPSSECCIYRVPMEVRNENEKAYTPRIVSIGPFHHNNKILKSTEQVKQRYMKRFVLRKWNSSLMEYFDFVKNREADIRNCYSERIEMNSNEFNTMVLVDSCFIIQFLISFHNYWERDDDSSLFLTLEMKDNIYRDLILLENQVPFFVLEGLFSLACSASFEALLDLAFFYFDNTLNLHSIAGSNKYFIKENSKSIKHFTHLLLMLYRPLPSPRVEKRLRTFYSSTNLAAAGLTFREKRLSEGLFDITLTNNVLEIPKLFLADDTTIQIRNLMALELCSYPEKSFIIDYFAFMLTLINSPADVDLLVREGIVDNWLSDNKAAANFFNSLFINTRFDMGNFYFSEFCNELSDYYKVHWLKAMLNRDYIQTLKRDYCYTPWKTASTIAAIMLLVLSLIQTVCSIISTGMEK
ncbi:hypothetical protein LguiB_027665 [Lonicera macranthoides]